MAIVGKHLYNMTQHDLVPEQIRDGIEELPEEIREEVHRLLTFMDLPLLAEIGERAGALADLAQAHGAWGVMIGGAPFLMSALSRELKTRGIRVFFAFSLREAADIRNADGSVGKMAVFRYRGLVEG